MRKLSRALSLVLVAAMVMGMTPDVCLVSYAAEQKEEIVAEAEPTAGDEQVVEAEPVVEVEPVEEEKPVVEESPVVESSAVEESTPVEESGVVVESTSAEENSTVVQSTPVEESGVVVETTVVEESSTVVEPITVEETTTVEETETVEEQNFDFLDGEEATYYTVTEVISNADILYLDNCVTSESKVMEGTDIRFSVTPDSRYHVVAVYANTVGGKEELTPVEGVYTIENSKITTDITICVETEKETYQVSTQIEGATQNDVVCTFLNNNIKDGKIDFDETVEFRVAVKDEDKNYIASVGYKQGESETVNPLYADENEVYTIGSLTEDITIVITAVEYKYVKLLPVYMVGDDTEEYDKPLDGIGFEYVSGNYSNPRTGEQISFKVFADQSQYTIGKVTYNEEKLTATDGIYTITVAEDAEKIVMLFNTVNSANWCKVAFDYESAEATVTGEEYAVAGQAYTFTVNPATEYHYDVRSVNAYSLAKGEVPSEDNKLTLSKNGNDYTIEAEEVVEGKEIYIDVETGLECYTVTFNIGEGVTVTVGDRQLTAESTDKTVKAEYQERIYFTADAGEKKVNAYANIAYDKNNERYYYVDVIGDETVTITAEEYGSATIHLEYSEDYVKDVKVLYKDQPLEIVDNTVTVSEKYYDDLCLFVTMEKGYGNDQVFYDGQTITNPSFYKSGGKEGRYCIYAINNGDEKTIKIYAQITDKKDVYTIEFQGNLQSGDLMKLAGIDKTNIFGKVGNTIITDKAGEFTFGIYQRPGYTIKSVTYEGNQLVKDGEWYTLNIDENIKKYIVKVEKVANTSDSIKTVTINNKSKDASYKIISGMKKVANKQNTYEIEAGNTVLKFEVTSNKYEPSSMTYMDTSGEKKSLYRVSSLLVGNNLRYTYDIPAALIADQSVIEIDANGYDISAPPMITFNPEEVEIEYVTCDGVVADDIDEASGIYAVSMKQGQTIAVKVKAKHNCKITGAKVWNSSVKPKIKGDTVEFTDKLTGFIDLVIDSVALHEANPLSDAKGNTVSSVNNTYSLTAGQTYTATIRAGVAGMAKMKSVQVLDNKKKETSEIGVRFYPGYQSADIEIPHSAAGKKYTVIFTSEKGAKVTYNLSVLPTPSKIAVTGVTNGVLTQASDTVKEYKLTITPNNVDKNDIGIKVESRYGVEARITEKGMLSVSVPAGAPVNEVAKIKFYIKSKSADTTCYIDAKNGGELTIKRTAATTVTKVAPVVKLQSSDDIALKLTLSSTFADTLVTGKLWYKVEIAAQAKDAPAVMNPVTYIPREGNSQTVDIQVMDRIFGQGEACKYDVKVTLVQTKDGSILTKANEAIKTAAVSKTTTTKNLATKNPYYETKLSLKKEAKMVYTGQQNVLVGTAVYSKNTTFTQGVSLPGRDYAMEQLAASVEGNQLFVSPGKDVKPGKYRLYVLTGGPNDMCPATADITVDVVKGIHTLAIEAPGNMIYKELNKPATLKLTPIYNWGEKTDQPKTKKVNWSIVDAFGNPITPSSSLYGKVTIKNGTITVAKDYVISDQSKFWVKAEAADYPGNDTSAMAGPFTISAECTEIGEVVLAKYVNDDDYQVIARNNQTLTLEEVKDGVIVVAIKKGVAEKDIYEWDEALDLTKVKFSCNNNKNVYLYDNFASFSGVGKNIIFTAQTQDGGKKKATIKINIDYVPTEELDVSGVEVILRRDMSVWATRTDSAFTFKGHTNESFLAVYLDKPYTDYKITVNSGGKVVTKSSDTTGLAMTAKTMTFTLQYTSSVTKKAVSKKYTVTNENFQTATGANAKTKSKLYSTAYECEMIYEVNSAYAGKYVWVSFDEAGRGRDITYISLPILLKNNMEPIRISEDGTFNVTFRSESEEMMYWIPKGSYRMMFTYGTYDGSVFTPETKPMPVTLKVEDYPKAPQYSYKMNTSYKLSMRDGSSAPFTYQDKKNPDKPIVTELRNANINGQCNNFRDYFELDENGLRIKEGITQEDLIKMNKNDLIGYIHENRNYGYLKITVTLVDTLNKYTTYAMNVAPSGDMNSEVAVCIGKEVVGIKAAYVTGTKGANAKVTGTFKANAVNENGSVTLHSSDATLGIHTVTMYVIPETSGYWSQISTLTGDDLNKAIQKYGIKVTATVKVTNTEPLG